MANRPRRQRQPPVAGGEEPGRPEGEGEPAEAKLQRKLLEGKREMKKGKARR